MNKENELKEEDVLVVRALLKVFKEQEDKERVMITYSELSDKLYKEDACYIHQEKFSPYFDRIEDVCHKLDIPYITSIVVSENTRRPSSGYDKVLIRHNIVSSLDTNERKREIKHNETVKGQKNKDWAELEKYLDDNYGKN